MSETHETPVKTPKQLIALVVASFALPIIVIVLLVNYVDNSMRSGAGTNGLSEEQVAQRIAPVARVEIRDTHAASTGQNTLPAIPMTPPNDSAAANAAAAAIAAIASMPSSANANNNSTTTANSSAGTTAQSGKALYQQVCQVCHMTGVAGAPKFGDKAEWAPRLKVKMDTIYRYALHGKGAMPPKGGAAASDEEVKAAVDYMINAVK